MIEQHTQTIELIALDRINVLNPRVRSKRTFELIVSNISAVGLKRPITVARREVTDGTRYDLVCGQGRYEAYKALGQKENSGLCYWRMSTIASLEASSKIARGGGIAPWIYLKTSRG